MIRIAMLNTVHVFHQEDIGVYIGVGIILWLMIML
jgi:hypothetical protein